MSIALNILIVVLLIAASGLGGYLMAKIKLNALLDDRADAYRAQVGRLKRTGAAASIRIEQLTRDLDQSKRRVRRYEAALRGPAPEDDHSLRQTAHYDVPDLHQTSAQLDSEVLQHVEKAVDVDRFRVDLFRREIA
jgi:hypothetical protein